MNKIDILKKIGAFPTNRRDLAMSDLENLTALKGDLLVMQSFSGKLELTEEGRDFVTKAAEVDNSTGYEHNPMLHMISLDLRRAAYHVLLNCKNGHFTAKTRDSWSPADRVGINRLHKDGCLAMDDMADMWVLTPLGKSTLLKLQGILEEGHKYGDGVDRPEPVPGEAIQYDPSNHVPEALINNPPPVLSMPEVIPDPVYTRQQCNAIALRKVAEFRQLLEEAIDPFHSMQVMELNGIMADAERTIITNVATQDELL